MAYPGQMMPAGPKLGAEEFRHEMEWPATIGTVVIAIVIFFIIGKLTNMLVAIAIPLALSLFSIWVANASHKGHMVQVGPNQFPHLYKMAQEIAERLSMPMPHVYVTQSPEINAYASGILAFNVVFHSALLEALSEAEIAAVMAHEFGHIKCRHVTYMVLQQAVMGGLGNNILLMPLKFLLSFSSRTKEYSADRAGLLGTMDIQACVTSELKLAVGPKLYEQMNIRAYVQQIADFNNQSSSKFIEMLGNSSHPMTINRIQSILRFYRSEKYQRLAHRHGRAGTTTLTSGAAGTADLFHRVAAKAEWERQLRAVNGTPVPAVASTPVVQPAPLNQGAAPAFQPQISVPVLEAAPAQAATVTCSSCGLPLASHARFCPSCGTGVSGVSTAPQPSAPAPEAPPVGRPVVQVVRRVARVTDETASAAPPAEPADTPAQAPATCTTCGNQLTPGAKFCGNCGAPGAR